MKEKAKFIRAATEKQLRVLQTWRKAIKVIEKEFTSKEPDAALLRASLDRLDGWLISFPEERAAFIEIEAEITQRYDRYTRQFEGLLRESCNKKGYSVTGSFPNLTIDGLIQVKVNPNKNAASINRKRASDLSMPTIMGKVVEEQKRLWDRRFNPKAFLNDLYEAYSIVNERTVGGGKTVALKDTFDQLAKVIEKYEFDMFAADLSKLVESRQLETENKKQLELTPVRDSRQAVFVFDRRSKKGRYLGLIGFR